MGSKNLLALMTSCFLATLLASCGSVPSNNPCTTVHEVQGHYSCHGECVVREASGTLVVQPVTGERDAITPFPGATTQPIFQNHITSTGSSFEELEIGTLVGLTMRTATAQVNQGGYPVLEEYVFDVGPSCEAVGFTKVVRNPTHDNFKACSIECRKMP